MAGTFRHGDILLVNPATIESVRPGDVVAFKGQKSDGSIQIVAHRVVRRLAGALVTQGDNCPAPDPIPIPAHDLVGRVCFVQRGSQVRPVWGGMAGKIWARYRPAVRRAMRIGRSLYRLLRASGLARSLWRPQVIQVRLTTAEGDVVKFVHRQRTVACWWPEAGHFICQKPYDLVLTLPGD